MSTRSVITFITKKSQFRSAERFSVYMHHDGYPSGMAKAINNAIPKAWAFSRFDASEFSAAFIAGNKMFPGGIYLSKGPKAHFDLDYAYDVWFDDKRDALMIKAMLIDNDKNDKQVFNTLYTGRFDQFITKVKDLDEVDNAA